MSGRLPLVAPAPLRVDGGSFKACLSPGRDGQGSGVSIHGVMDQQCLHTGTLGPASRALPSQRLSLRDYGGPQYLRPEPIVGAHIEGTLTQWPRSGQLGGPRLTQRCARVLRRCKVRFQPWVGIRMLDMGGA